MIGRRNVASVFIALLAVASISVVLAPSAAQTRQHLRISDTNSDLQSLDPQFGGTLSGEPPLLSMIYEGLVRLKPGSTSVDDIEPALAERWAASQDRRSWTFFLRKGVQFHRGFGEVTSADAKFSLERNLTRTSPWRNSYANIESVDAPNKYIVRVTLRQPDPFFFLSVADYRGAAAARGRADRGESEFLGSGSSAAHAGVGGHAER